MVSILLAFFFALGSHLRSFPLRWEVQLEAGVVAGGQSPPAHRFAQQTVVSNGLPATLGPGGSKSCLGKPWYLMAQTGHLAPTKGAMNRTIEASDGGCDMANGCPIFRYVKHKSGRSLGGAVGHHLRVIPTHNADPERTPENQILYGLDDRKRILESVKKATEPLVKRKDANRAVELFLGASDEFWENGGDWTELGKAHLTYLKHQFGEENIIAMGVHLDETTPHFWAIVTPIHEGKLRSNFWFDGPQKCRDFVDKAVPFFEHLGMVRSRENVKANHIEIATWHQAQSGNKAAQRRLEREHKKRLADAESRVLAAEMRAEKAEKNAENLRIELDALRVRKLLIVDDLKEAKATIELQKTEGEKLQKERDSLMKEQQRLQSLMASFDIETRQRIAANAEKFQAARKKFMP